MKKPETSTAKNGDRRARGPHGRILVVEDDFLVAMQLESDLRDEGHDVLGPARTAADAVDLAAREQPDLVVMDIRLVGERDGVDAALEIFRNSGIRTLFATAHSDARLKARAAPAAPLGWVQKPYSRACVLAEVASALRSVQRAG